MGRERLMQQQRERMEARRKRLKEAAKKAAEAKTKKPAPAKVKGIGPVKDGATYARKLKNSKTEPTGVGPVKSGAAYARSLTKGKSATTTKADPKPSLKNKPVNKVPSTTTTKPTTKPASDKAVEGGYTISAKNRVKRGKDGMPYQGEFPGSPEKKSKPKRVKRTGGSRALVSSRSKASQPKKNATKVITIGQKKVTMIYNGSKWVPKK